MFKSHNVDITCEKCKSGSVATAKYEVRHLPRVVILHLKRFQMNMYGSLLEKRKEEVNIPDTLDFKKLMGVCSPEESDTEGIYKLRVRSFYIPEEILILSRQSVIHHKGSKAGSGHYVADVLDSKENYWTRFDDSLVMEVYGDLSLCILKNIPLVERRRSDEWQLEQECLHFILSKAVEIH